MLHLHFLKLGFEMLIFRHLCLVLIVDALQVVHNFVVLTLHLRDFGAPLGTLLVLLLPEYFALVLNALLLKLQHLYFVIYVTSLDRRKLKLALNLTNFDLVASFVVIISKYCRRFLATFVPSGPVVVVLAASTNRHLVAIIIAATVTLDVLVISQFLSRGCIPLPLLLYAAIVRRSVRSTEGLLRCGILVERRG